MADYVIIGAGSAGCVLAGRLSEDPAVTVTLVEAGPGSQPPLLGVPAAFPTLLRTEWDWDFRTIPQPSLAGRSLYWPRGRGLGGSSAINAMLYLRGHPHDYRTWARLVGSAGWDWPAMLAMFLRSEDNVRGASPWHGVGGPLSVADSGHRHASVARFLVAAEQFGLPANPDFAVGEPDGVGWFQVTTRGGRRWSAADAYLRPASGRPNLRVGTGVHVHRILIEGGRATGVVVHEQATGRRRVIRADREVLLAAGAIGSPHLLMLSGIGPADHLRALGCPVHVDSPNVGEGLADHLAVPLIWDSRRRSIHDAQSVAALARWQWDGGGPLASTIAEAGGFWRSTSGLPAPDIQWHVGAAAFHDHGLTEPLAPGFSIGPTLLAPQSRGRVRLRTADPQHRPLIDPGYLREPVDLAALTAAIGTALAIAAQPALASILHPRDLPASSDRADIVAHIRNRAETIYHPVGTCAMGADEHSVLDARLRVRGVSGLRVVDASAMPTVPRGNTNAPTIALAERAVDLITGRREALHATAAARTPQPAGC